MNNEKIKKILGKIKYCYCKCYYKCKFLIHPYIELNYHQYSELSDKYHSFLDSNIISGANIENTGIDLLSQINNITYVAIQKRKYKKICKLLKIKKGEINGQ